MAISTLAIWSTTLRKSLTALALSAAIFTPTIALAGPAAAKGPISHICRAWTNPGYAGVSMEPCVTMSGSTVVPYGWVYSPSTGVHVFLRVGWRAGTSGPVTWGGPIGDGGVVDDSNNGGASTEVGGGNTTPPAGYCYYVQMWDTESGVYRDEAESPSVNC
ncbi:hypothetical protein [Streptacidiphilus sp. EB129]|uniref:hypothetical protein n=1 Tax=Streptacidiphilus sp. EB129 TaxID=3156262 RepID=UPI0035194AE9